MNAFFKKRIGVSNWTSVGGEHSRAWTFYKYKPSFSKRLDVGVPLNLTVTCITYPHGSFSVFILGK